MVNMPIESSCDSVLLIEVIIYLWQLNTIGSRANIAERLAQKS